MAKKKVKRVEDLHTFVFEGIHYRVTGGSISMDDITSSSAPSIKEHNNFVAYWSGEGYWFHQAIPVNKVFMNYVLETGSNCFVEFLVDEDLIEEYELPLPHQLGDEFYKGKNKKVVYRSVCDVETDGYLFFLNLSTHELNFLAEGRELKELILDVVTAGYFNGFTKIKK